MQERALTHFRKDKEIEEVHGAKHDEHPANLYRQRFNPLLSIVDDVAEFEGHCYVAEVDEVKADDEEVVDRIRESFVSVENVNQENASIFCSVRATQIVRAMLIVRYSMYVLIPIVMVSLLS